MNRCIFCDGQTRDGAAICERCEAEMAEVEEMLSPVEAEDE